MSRDDVGTGLSLPPSLRGPFRSGFDPSVSSVHDDAHTPPSNPAPDGASFLPPDWAQLQPLLDELLDLPPEQRADRLAELTRGDSALQRQLERLLADTDRAAPLLDGSVARRFDELASNDSILALPEVLAGRYRVGRELGRGGMATVYLARDEKHGRDVAIKVIRQDLSASLGHERFLREIEIAARLRHPNIVPLYDSGDANGSLFFVMPYEDGQSLRERLRRAGALPIADALGILRDVARALAYAHEHGVVHRDIKPDNVMLSGDAAVVTDFGIAKAVSVALSDAPDATLTQAGTVIGTPAYIAPEQATGDVGVDHRADIYSFGCLAYELFAGHPPFQEKGSHLLIAAHIANVPRPITELCAEVPRPVADLLERCLAKAPADRPQTARDLLPILDGGPRASVSTPTPASQREARRWSRPRMWAPIAIIAGVVAIGGVFAMRSVSAAAPVTVAVLPFGNIAGDSAIELVADGLADEVASSLAHVPGILIKSRTGARRYRGQLAPDVTEAGARLKADYLLTAVIRQEGGRWILSADFEHAADASSLWDARFDVSPNEQGAIADSIVGSLTGVLRRQFPRAIGVAPAPSTHQRTSNTEAYRLYVQGQEKLARRGQSVNEAAELFRQAIRLDSAFAPAYSGLSMAVALSPWFHKVPPAQVREEVMTAAGHALALDSSLSQPHVALGVAHWQAFRWEAAAKGFQTAIRLNPRDVEARVQYARLLRDSGRFTDGLNQLRVARDLDPASALVLSQMSITYMVSGQLDSAVVEGRRALETDSTNYTTLLSAAWAYYRSGRTEQARALTVQLPENYEVRGYLMAKLGDVEGARRVIRSLDARPTVWADETRRALTYLGLGDTAHALSALERATDAGEIWPTNIPVPQEPYDAIRKSARFRVLLERVGLREYIPVLTR